MKNLSISKKLVVGFGVVLVLMLLSAILSLYSINNIGEQTQLYSIYTVPHTQHIADMRLCMENLKEEMLLAIAERNAKSISEAISQAEAYGTDFTEYLDVFSKNQRNHDLDADIEKIRTIAASAVSFRKEIAELAANTTEESLDRALNSDTEC